MKAGIFVLTIFVLAAGCSREPAQTVITQPAATATPGPTIRPGEIEFKKDNDTALKPIEKKKQINIKLKRSYKGEYSWDIVGTDTKDIIRTNRELQKEFPN
jgi:hypothetical protein